MFLNTLSFFLTLFWLSIILFLINCYNLLSITLYSEIMWIILYIYVVISGNINDDLNLTTSSFFFLALASLEFCISFVLTTFFKKFIKSFDFNIFTNFLELNNLLILKLKWQLSC